MEEICAEILDSFLQRILVPSEILPYINSFRNSSKASTRRLHVIFLKSGRIVFQLFYDFFYRFFQKHFPIIPQEIHLQNTSEILEAMHIGF